MVQPNTTFCTGKVQYAKTSGRIFYEIEWVLLTWLRVAQSALVWSFYSKFRIEKLLVFSKLNKRVLKTWFFRQFKTRPTRYSMDLLRASLGNNEFTRLVANRKCMHYNEIKINLCYIHMQIFFWKLLQMQSECKMYDLSIHL